MISQSSDSKPAALPNLHDGNLVGIVLVDHQCTLFISDAVGLMHTITLRGVERLRAEDFLEGNIVLDLTVQTGSVVNEADVLYALSIDEDMAENHRVYVDKMLGRIGRGELHLFELASSYGCTVASVCAEVVADAAVDRASVVHRLGL
jgi:hypothetical protein